MSRNPPIPSSTSIRGVWMVKTDRCACCLTVVCCRNTKHLPRPSRITVSGAGRPGLNPRVPVSELASWRLCTGSTRLWSRDSERCRSSVSSTRISEAFCRPFWATTIGRQWRRYVFYSPFFFFFSLWRCWIDETFLRHIWCRRKERLMMWHPSDKNMSFVLPTGTWSLV